MIALALLSYPGLHALRFDQRMHVLVATDADTFVLDRAHSQAVRALRELVGKLDRNCRPERLTNHMRAFNLEVVQEVCDVRCELADGPLMAWGRNRQPPKPRALTRMTRKSLASSGTQAFHILALFALPCCNTTTSGVRA